MGVGRKSCLVCLSARLERYHLINLHILTAPTGCMSHPRHNDAQNLHPPHPHTRPAAFDAVIPQNTIARVPWRGEEGGRFLNGAVCVCVCVCVNACVCGACWNRVQSRDVHDGASTEQSVCSGSPQDSEERWSSCPPQERSQSFIYGLNALYTWEYVL